MATLKVSRNPLPNFTALGLGGMVAACAVGAMYSSGLSGIWGFAYFVVLGSFFLVPMLLEEDLPGALEEKFTDDPLEAMKYAQTRRRPKRRGRRAAGGRSSWGSDLPGSHQGFGGEMGLTHDDSMALGAAGVYTADPVGNALADTFHDNNDAR